MLSLTITIFLLSSLAFPGISTPLKADVTLEESKIVNISVDPRIELLSVVQLLSDYPLLTGSHFQYKREVLNYFSPYKSHPAVQKFKEMSEKGFTSDAPPAVMLYLSDPPELKNVLPFTNYVNLIIDRAGGEENLEAFIEALRDFAIKSNFMDFFNAHKDFYSTLINDVKVRLGKYKDVSMLEDFYGISKNSYNIIIATLYPNGGYGPQIESEPSKYDIYCIIGPFFSEDTLRLIVWHEFSHSFVNPTTEKYRDEVNKYFKLFLPIIDKDVSGSMAYLQWWRWYVAENIVRAVSGKFNKEVIEQKFGPEVAEEILREILFHNDVEQGYIYVEGIYGLLDTYEESRDKYPTFEDFYPVILNYFSEISKLSLLPMDFLGSEQDQNKVVLTWRDTSDDEEGFKIYRKSDNEEGFKLIAILKENTISFEDTTIEFGKTYTYRVASFNENGENFAPEDVIIMVRGSLNEIVVIFQIGNSTFTVNGTSNALDSPPIIKNSVILLPIRAVVEALGGTVFWNETERKVTILLGSTTIELWIGKNTAIVNRLTNLIDPLNNEVVPEIINNRTMLPLNFVANSLGATIDYNETTQTITVVFPKLGD